MLLREAIAVSLVTACGGGARGAHRPMGGGIEIVAAVRGRRCPGNEAGVSPVKGIG